MRKKYEKFNLDESFYMLPKLTALRISSWDGKYFLSVHRARILLADGNLFNFPLLTIISFHLLHTCRHVRSVSGLSSPTIIMVSLKTSSGRIFQPRSEETEDIILSLKEYGDLIFIIKQWSIVKKSLSRA